MIRDPHFMANSDKLVYLGGHSVPALPRSLGQRESVREFRLSGQLTA